MKKHLLASALVVLGLCASAQSKRIALYEEFTGETCPPCAASNPGLNALLALPTNTPKVIAIKWQVPIPSAPTKTWSLYQTNKKEIDWRYKLSGYGYGISSAPSGKMDGQNVTVFGAGSNHPANLTSAVISTAASYTSAFEVNIVRSWESDLSAANLTITIEATAPFTSVGNLMFRTVMVERLIQFSVQPGTNGEKVFEDVAIKSFPTTEANGVLTGMGTLLPSTWTVGQKHTFTLNCPIPSYTRKITEVAFVGFIQDDGNKKVQQTFRAEPQGVDPNDAQVLNVTAPSIICSNSFVPVVTIKNNGSTDITSMDITPSLDGVAGTPINWTGTFVNGSFMTFTLNAVNSATAGGHKLEVSITNVSGGDNNAVDNIGVAHVYMGTGTMGKTVVEDFEKPEFPPALWGMTNTDMGTKWEQVTGATVGGYGASSTATKYDAYNNKNIGDQDELYMPPTNLLGNLDPELTFEYAYVKNTAPNLDVLEVKASDDCGATWSTFYTASGNNLVTTNTSVIGPFTPNASEHWSFQTVKLTGMNKVDILVKFVVTNGNGNNLYLDNINLVQGDPTNPPPPPPPNPSGIGEDNANQFFAAVFPNPTSGNVSLSLNSSVTGDASITVVNALGQLVSSKNITLNGGHNRVEMALGDLPAGIYSVNVESDNGSFSKKLTISK